MNITAQLAHATRALTQAIRNGQPDISFEITDAMEALAAYDADPKAVAELRVIADRIYRADVSGNNGAVMGEANLCKSFSLQLSDALARVQP